MVSGYKHVAAAKAVRLALIVSFLPGSIYGVLNPGCQCVTFQKNGDKLSGEFFSPSYPSQYRNNIDCLLYTFIAPDDEPMIVEITFTDLDLGQVNQYGNCNTGDKLRVYLHQTSPSINEEVKADTQICGNMTMMSNKRLYSKYGVLILELITDEVVRKKQRGFKGIFNFLPKASFQSDGVKISGSQCDYRVSAGAKLSGKFFSPGYPQSYPPNVNCSWVLSGDWHESVKITFLKIDLAVQATSQPRKCNSADSSYDIITVYDGDSNDSPVIGQFCGYHVYEEIFSTGTKIKVVFTSNDQLSMQGFAALFSFIKPVLQPRYKCDREIKSKYIKQGSMTSELYPNPYTPASLCTYKFYAAANERVAIKFIDFDLNTGGADSTVYRSCDLSDKVTVSIQVDNSYPETLMVLCGTKLPPAIMSNGPFLQLRFEAMTKNSQARGFKFQYQFVTDFGIKADEVVPYTPCTFWYKKSVKAEGEITSPNYPGIYPKGTLCQYLFDGDGSRVSIKFTDFDVIGYPPLCNEERDSDYVRLSNYRDTEDKMMDIYCINDHSASTTHITSKVIESDKDFFMITFKSGMAGSGRGFRAEYKFMSLVENQLSQPTVAESSGSNLRFSCHFILFALLVGNLMYSFFI